ncbi:hypothetical protein [Pseudomonas sp. C9-3]|uniref:hypothetical protein n=1 Tax=Pseudomonas sp. C9-3 TaxID=3078264 RepID=UPI0028EA8CC1|nr:hypothetical protein [Pseudomonas sp. C9-3]
MNTIDSRFIRSSRYLCLAAALLCTSGCETISAGSILMGCAFRSSLEIEPQTLPDAQVGVPYRAMINIAGTPGGPVAYIDVQLLPQGLRFDYQDRQSHGQLVGTPQEAGSISVKVSAGTFGTMCAGKSVSRELTLHVAN